MKLLEILETQTWSFCQRPWLMSYLIKPISLQLLGFYGSVVISFLLMDMALTMGTHGNFTLAVAFSVFVFLTGLLGIWLFIAGFWDFLVLFVTLNHASDPNLDQSALTQLLKAQRNRLKPAKGVYSLYLLIIMLLQATVVLIVMIPFLPVMMLLMNDPDKLAWVAQLSNVIMALAILLAYTPLSYGFQVLAFSDKLSTLSVLLKSSVEISRGHFTRTFLALLVCAVMTIWIVPMAVETLLRWTSLINPLDTMHSWIVSQWLRAVSGMPGFNALLQQALTASTEVSRALSADFIVFVVSSLLLPWGTLVFAALYKDIENWQGDRV